MSVTDDLTKLAAEDVVYLTRTFSSVSPPGVTAFGGGFFPSGGHGSTEVFRGRLREALNGDWVFNASTGQNGVVGFMLGGTGENSWGSSESPATGVQVTVTYNVFNVEAPPVPIQTLNEVIVLTTLIPSDFAE